MSYQSFKLFLFVVFITHIVCHECNFQIVNTATYLLKTPLFPLNIGHGPIKCYFNVSYSKLARVNIGVENFNLPTNDSNSCELNFFKFKDEAFNEAVLCNYNISDMISMLTRNLFVDINLTNHSDIKGIVVVRLFHTPNTFDCYHERKSVGFEAVCDGIFDCEDHSDEMNCNSNCNIDEALCNVKDAKCFSPKLQRCNQVIDCPNGEDELHCTSTCPEMHCGDNASICYTFEQLCDGIIDCPDGTDEQRCPTMNCPSPFNANHHFICNNGQCISRILVNNGKPDCEDGSDEFSINKKPDFLALCLLFSSFMCVGFIYLICRSSVGRRRSNQFAAPFDFSTFNARNVNIEPGRNITHLNFSSVRNTEEDMTEPAFRDLKDEFINCHEEQEILENIEMKDFTSGCNVYGPDYFNV